MTKPKKDRISRFDESRPVRLVLLGLAALAILVAELLYGTDVKVLSPKGFIADEQFKLIVFSAVVLLAIGIPALVLFYYFAWRYRESNAKATYNPHLRTSKALVFNIWAIPSVFAVLLAFVMWPATHALEPNDPITASAKPINVQVIALRWKWLFIYPEQNIATVNYVQIPAGTPVQFDLTADDAPMSSFWVPSLGGQLYAMTGHVNRLNLVAKHQGDFTGSSAEINGAGFAGMKFKVHAGSEAEFNQWVDDVRQSPIRLDAGTYQELLEPSENNPSQIYSMADPDLYANVLMKYTGSHGHMDHEHMDHQNMDMEQE